MAAKRALVVDDSKSARTFLARILEKYELDVVSVESAEQAIEYLRHHRPDVIFMDHLMPGMDGFQAVQAIKNNPRTATIPIMMYTSQEGELYLGQARALGAVGVLPKQIRPTDVSKVLYQLHLLPDRRSSEQSTFRPVGGSVVEIDDGGSVSPDALHAGSASRPLTDSSLREQIAELRRALAAAIENQADRLRADLRMTFENTSTELRWEPPEPRRVPWAGLAAAIATLLALASLFIAGRQAARTGELAGELAALRAELVQQAPEAARVARAGALGSTTGLAATLPGSVPGGDAAGVPAPGGPAPRRAAAAATPLIEVVPYGEDALGGSRLESLRQLFDRLIAQGYRGDVDVKVFPGRFCLMGNAADGFSLAPDDTPYARCDLIGSVLPRDESGAPRVPVGFADLAGELRSASHGAIGVSVLAGDEKATLVAYPPVSDALTAGEWNRAAGANNRIEVHLR